MQCGQEERPRGREKKARHEAEGGTAQPSPRGGGGGAAAPASEFSPTVRAEVRSCGLRTPGCILLGFALFCGENGVLQMV